MKRGYFKNHFEKTKTRLNKYVAVAENGNSLLAEACGMRTRCTLLGCDERHYHRRQRCPLYSTPPLMRVRGHARQVPDSASDPRRARAARPKRVSLARPLARSHPSVVKAI